MVVAKTKLTSRLAKYSAAAVAAAATGMATTNADADLLSITGLSLSTSNSLEGFLSITGVTLGATSFGYSFANNAFSLANPLGGTATDFMIRAIFTAATGTALIAPRNGALAAFAPYFVGGPYNTGTYFMAANVGSAFNAAPSSAIFSGFPGGNTGGGFLVTWPWNNNPGGFAGGSGTIAMTFIGDDANTYNGWLDVSFGADSGGFLQQTITGIHVDTGRIAVPEPAAAMSLLCLGAAGLGGYRRRRAAA